ncbi:Branched-chain amino acid transport system permease protein OS=Castellaniella defragrans OX=75697 GN=HNR28_003054 PE=4 SV=1 [Castellaniella defragrans]
MEPGQTGRAAPVLPGELSRQKSPGHRPLASRLLWFAVVAVLIAALLPAWLSIYVLGILTVAYYYGVFAMSWDLLFGFAGEVNFGPTFLIGLGAYATGLLSTAGWPVWLCLLFGTIAAVAGGLALAVPALRLHGPYFGLVTLVAVLLLKDFIVLFASTTGGEIGMMVPGVLAISAEANYWYALGFMVVSAVLLYGYSRSSPGLILQAIGQDPTEAAALGFNVTKHKITAFCVSAVFSGLAGGMLALYMGTASVNTVVDFGVVVQVIIAAVLGGRRTIIGGVVGAIFLIAATEVLRPLGQLNTVVVAAVALAAILFLPDGLLGYFLNRRERA